MRAMLIVGTFFVALSLPVVAPSPEVVQAGPQLEEDGLAIYGTVMAPGTQERLSGVTVRLVGPAQGLFRPSTEAREVETGAGGRFGFTRLQPGRYRVQMPLSEGQAGFAPPGREVILTAEGPPADIRLWESRASQVSGRVLDAEGTPVAGAVVWPLREYWFDGRRRLGNREVPFGTPTDDDGRYTVIVSPDVRYYLMANPGNDQAITAHYYPGVVRVEDAVPVRVPPGSAELGGFDITLVDTPRTRLRFHLPLPEFIPGIAEPVSSFLEEGAKEFEAHVWPLGTGRIDNEAYQIALEELSDDVYLTVPLPPGEYELALRYPLGLLTGWREHLDAEYLDWRLDPIARVAVTVDPDDPDIQPDGSLDLGTIPPIARTSITGRIVIRDPNVGEMDSDTLPEFFLRPVGAFRSGSLAKFPSFSANGSFEFEGVHPDLYTFFLASDELPEDWYVQSIRSGSRDVLRNGLEVGGAVLPIEVVLASDGARIIGVARDASGQLVPDARILLIPPSGSRGPMARLPSVAAASTGAFSLSRVPPGDYRVLAVDPLGLALDYPIYEDPEFLRQYELRGELITVDPGVTMTIDPEAIPLLD